MPVLFTGSFYDAAAADPGGDDIYALVHLASAYEIEATMTTVLWDSEVVDAENVHNDVNPSRLTVPAAWDGRYGRISYNLVGDSTSLYAQSNRDGASYLGRALGGTSTAGANSVSAFGAILPLTQGQYYQVQASAVAVTPHISADPASWFQMEILPADFKGALVHKTANQALSAGTTTTIAFGSEVYDTDGFHDSVTNNSRMTVGSGMSLIRVSANLATDQASGQFVISMLKNGASARGLPIADWDSGNNEAGNVASCPLAVSSGDYFEVRGFHTTACNVLNDNATWFQIETLPSDLKYAVVHRSSGQSISAATTTTVQFNAELADVGGWHDNSVNNSRLTVPIGSGITHVRLTANVVSTSVANQFVVSMRKNGTTVVGLAQSECDTAGTDNVNLKTAILEVEEGDYFELRVFHTSATTIGSEDGTWFSIEEVRGAIDGAVEPEVQYMWSGAIE